PREIVSANAYLGAHAIYEAFLQGADIIICGRASDASPVIACAWYWWSWNSTNYDGLAGALVAGHLIECSAYVTGGFDAFDLDRFVDPGFPIAEIAKDGSCVITKHEGTGGMVTVDTCKSQLVYELQGNAYINSDVKAYLDDIEMEQVGEDRIRVHGARGAPPPGTTKLAVFYKGGYEMQALFNATGHNFEQKFALLEKQVRFHLGEEKLGQLDFLEFQKIGVPAANPINQNSALWRQVDLEEKFHFVNSTGTTESFNTTPPPKFEVLEERQSYDTTAPIPLDGGLLEVRLGSIALGRSGDKGANLNFGQMGLVVLIHVSCQDTGALRRGWRPEFSIERVEFPKIFAVHFVVYGILGRGVSSSKRLDGFGKGLIDYFRDKIPYRQDINPGINAASGFTPNLDTLQTVAQLQPAGVVPDEPNPANSFTESSLVQTLTTDASPCDTIVGGNGDMRYFGPPSGISLASTATTGRSGQQTPESWSKWTHPLIEPIFARRVMKPLPSWTDAFSLVSEFFTHQHQVFPCFNPPVFMSFLGQQYSSPCNESPTWWVSLNAVLAIAQRRRAEEAQAAEAEDLAWGYASNALAGTWDVLMRGTQLSSVQALLAIAWFFIGTPNPQPSFMLVGCAVRLALSIGIHIDSQDPSLSPVDSYMRKKVFWIAICLDRELCLRTGRPPCHDLNAVYVDPPLDAHDETEILVTIAGFQVNLFKAQMQLAVIQGSIYQDLHSNKLPTVLSDSISILQERLSTWCAEFAPSLLDNSVQDCEHHGLMRLYFSYYAAVIVVNRAHSLSYWSSPNHSDISTLSPIVRTSIEACIHASRSIIGLTKLIPGRWKSFHW
ncbi:hypothetical protein H9L39_20356, partial [Fusarium oxysporum f. sp. albedinis]